MSGALSINEPVRPQHTSSRDNINDYKLDLMEALEHFYITRKYKELELCANCKNSNIKLCVKCSTIYGNKQFQNAFVQNEDSVSVNSNCSSSSSKECLKGNSSKSLMQESFENLNTKNLMLNSNKQSPFKILTKQINRNSQKSYVKKLENSSSQKGNPFNTTQNNENPYYFNMRILNEKKKFRNDIKKNFEGISNGKKKKIIRHRDQKSTKLDLLNESSKILNYKEKNQETNNNDQSNDTTKQEEKEISNYFTQINEKFELNNTREVICKFRESNFQYWVMDVNNLANHEKIEILLRTECSMYENVGKPEKNLLYGCLFENNWYRGKIVSLFPKIIVHFVDFGKTWTYESEFKKIPEALQKAPGLVYQVFLKENTPEYYLTQNLETRKLKIKYLGKNCSGVPVVEIIKDSEFGKKEHRESDEIKYSIKEDIEKSDVLAPTTKMQEKYVIDTIKETSQGIILLTPGRGKIRFGSVFPDNDGDAKSCSEKILNHNSSNLTPIEAKEGDYVLVPDMERNNQRGKILCKLGTCYYILLIDSGVIMSANKVYSLSEEMKMYKGLGVVITIQEIFSEESITEIDVCYYSVIEKKEQGKWICRLRSTDKDNLLANVIIERPTQKGSTRSLKSGCSVEISAVGFWNTFYVREIDETSRWKLMELNKKINIFCETVPSLSSVPAIGDLCSAKFEDDQNFYRGLVKSIKDDKVEILFIDFGNSQLFNICSNSLSHINVKNLKPLPSGLEAIPFFAVQVSLAEVLPKSYSPKAKKYLQKLILENTELVLTYRNFYNEGVYLREKLTGNIVNDILNDKHSETVGSYSLCKNGKFFGESMKYTIFSVGTKCNMALLYVSDKEFKDNYTFWCSDASSENFNYVHSELNSKISAYCNSCSVPYRPCEQELCLAEFEGVWYRALILDVDDDNFIVFFPDFGNMCEVTSKRLRKIKEEFIAPPALAVNCTINDPERLKGKAEITKKVFDVLENWMNKYISKVEICKYEDETFYLRIPEVEAIFLAQ